MRKICKIFDENLGLLVVLLVAEILFSGAVTDKGLAESEMFGVGQ